MSSSFNKINYSLRPNKSIQRSIIFEAIAQLVPEMIQDPFYIGLGSIWFTDFSAAHKKLGINRMTSIESDELGYKRALFNRPFKTVDVEHGLSTEILKKLAGDPELSKLPWIVWLDYDGIIGETMIEDLQLLTENAPSNSLILCTVNADSRSYHKPADAIKTLKFTFGDVVPSDLNKSDVKSVAMSSTIADLALKYMSSAAIKVSRPGGFIPAFSARYSDGPWMTTFGGVLPSKEKRQSFEQKVKSKRWPGLISNPIVTPILTLRETAVLQSTLPRTRKLTRAAVQRLGFDLSDEQIEAFQRFYRYYPAYAEISM
ncbi:O-methyltransferase [Henriciella litoralis]|uniref:O-methyltransferase n=1 Tax=Henriciella litoralis TaxID=568102 RepID=UPI00111BF279|nr:O-methyltransferase [Henriciella litoralis]